MKKYVIVIGTLILILFHSAHLVYAAGKVKLSNNITMSEGTSKKLLLKNSKKKVSWNVSSGQSNITLKNKSANSVKIIAIKAGKAKVTAKIGKKKYTCVVTIKESMNQDEKMVEVVVGKRTFQAELANTQAAKRLVDSLPMTISTNELNGNEKYAYMTQYFPTDDNISGQIKSGDIMLFGNDCLVFFYKDFKTSYTYTKIAKIRNGDAFAKAVGNGNVTITIQKKK